MQMQKMGIKMLNGTKNYHELTYYIVDVFTDKQYGGNQLAVFIDTENMLDDEDMLQITREIGFAESSFVKAVKGNNISVRIFTPEYEVPFAGHPTIGTSFVSSNHFNLKKDLTLIFKTKNVHVKKEDNRYSLELNSVDFLDELKSNQITSAFGLEESDIDGEYEIEEVSTGLPYLLIPLKSLEAMKRISFDDQTIIQLLKRLKKYKSNSESRLSTSFYFFTSETVVKSSLFHTRMFCLENNKMFEDSAKGSAASCLVGYLLKNKIRGFCETTFIF